MNNRDENTAVHPLEWAGLYLATSQKGAKGYMVMTEENKKNGVNYLQQFIAKDSFEILASDDEDAGIGSIDSLTKAKSFRADIKNRLGIELGETEPLTSALGENGFAYQGVLHSSGSKSESDIIEITIPLQLLDKVSMDKSERYTTSDGGLTWSKEKKEKA